MRLADLTLGELHDAAVAAGWEFSFGPTTGMFQSASPLLGYDRGPILLGREMGRRWPEFVAFATLRLLAAGHVQADRQPPSRARKESP